MTQGQIACPRAFRPGYIPLMETAMPNKDNVDLYVNHEEKGTCGSTKVVRNTRNCRALPSS